MRVQGGASWRVIDAATQAHGLAVTGAHIPSVGVAGFTLAPWAMGEAYPNFIADADPERLQAAYSPAVWARLRAVRAAWDPDGVFAAGHAIPLP